MRANSAPAQIGLAASGFVTRLVLFLVVSVLSGVLVAGLVLPILYLTLEMSFQGRRAMQARGGFRAVAKARDE